MLYMQNVMQSHLIYVCYAMLCYGMECMYVHTSTFQHVSSGYFSKLKRRKR